MQQGLLDPHLARLQARLAQGCGNALALWRELRADGFPGTAKQVHRWLARHRPSPARTAPHGWRNQSPPAPAASRTPSGPGQPAALPSATRLAWLLVQPPAALSVSDAAVAARVEQDREAAGVAALARRFTALVRGCGASRKADPEAALKELDTWLTDARTAGVRAMETFAAGLEQDGAAVRAALTTPWSNGQAEGQVTRLKLLKRQMHGRAGFDLLRRRTLLVA